MCNSGECVQDIEMKKSSTLKSSFSDSCRRLRQWQFYCSESKPIVFLNAVYIKGADTSPTHTHTQNDLVAMHMIYLVPLFVELFHYADEQSTL